MRFHGRIPQSPAVTAQHKARPSGALSGEPECQKASLEKGGGPAKLVEGFLWNLLLDVRGFTEGTSQSPAVTAPLSGEP